MDQMARFNSIIKPKCSKFRTSSQRISNEIEEIVLSLSDVSNQCSCGCSRPLKSVQSHILQNYISKKSRWIKMLRVKRDRISELSSIYDIIFSNGCTEYTFNNLDLNLVKSDIKRQPWVFGEASVQLVSNSIYTFCIYNNVAYWQGMHDVAAALSHLRPTPSIGELSALIEQLYKTYALIVFSPNTEDVASKANALSLKWRLLFQYFFPKFSHQFDSVCDPSFSSGWFITLGFYRFGCAYIALIYTYLLIISRYEPLESFIFRELGYVAMRGYIDYLIKNKVSFDFNSSQLFSNYSQSNLIVNSIVNSNKIHLDCENYINVSRNPFDTLNHRELELADFPLIYIFKCSNILCNTSPSVKSIDPSKLFVETSFHDLFSETSQAGMFECHLDDSPKQDFPINYKRKRFRNVLRKIRMSQSFSDSGSISNISDHINAEMAFSYLTSLRRFGNLYCNTNKIKCDRSVQSSVSLSPMANPKIQYQIIDLRSDYLKSGKALDKIFGITKKGVVIDVNPEEILEASFLDTNFTMWIVMTDDGYNFGTDQLSIESLNKGLQVMFNLSKRSVTCLTLFKDGYKGLLRQLNEQVPERPSFLSLTRMRKFLSWDAAEDSALSPTRNISEIRSSLATAAISFENRIVQGISDIKLFNRFRPSLKLIKSQSSSNLFLPKSRSRSRSTSSSFDLKAYSTEIIQPCSREQTILYCIRLRLANSLVVSIMSNGTIKVNGMILHPSQYKKAISDPHLKTLVLVSSLLTVNSVDGILDLEQSSYGRGKLNRHLNQYFVNNSKDLLRKYIVEISEFSDSVYPSEFKGQCLENSNRCFKPLCVFWFTVSTLVGGVVSGTRILGFHNLRTVYFVDKTGLIKHLINCYRPKFHFITSHSDTSNQISNDQTDSGAIINLDVPSNQSTTTNVRSNQVSLEDLSSLQPRKGLSYLKQLRDLKLGDKSASENPSVILRGIPRLKNLKVFSRTHDLSSRRSTSSSSTVETRVFPKPKSGDNVPMSYNPNVFTSRSVLNRRNNSK